MTRAAFLAALERRLPKKSADMRIVPGFTVAVGIYVAAAAPLRADVIRLGPPLMPGSSVGLVMAGIAMSLAFVFGGLWVIRNNRRKTLALYATAAASGVCAASMFSGPNEVMGFLLFYFSLVVVVGCLVWTVRCNRRLARVRALIPPETATVDADRIQIEHQYRESKLMLLATFLFFLSLLICVVNPQTPRVRPNGVLPPSPDREGPAESRPPPGKWRTTEGGKTRPKDRVSSVPKQPTGNHRETD